MTSPKYKAGDILVPKDKDDMPIGYQHDEFEVLGEDKQFSGIWNVKVVATGLEFAAATWYLDQYFLRKEQPTSGFALQHLSTQGNTTWKGHSTSTADLYAAWREAHEAIAGFIDDGPETPTRNLCTCETVVLMRDGCQCGGE